MAVLRSPYLTGVVRLREVASGGKPLIAGETSHGVAQLQAAMRDLGYPLARSTSAGGTMDGFFGGETQNFVKQFQQDQRLPATALGDAQTLGAVDQALVLRLAAPIARIGRSMKRYSTRSEDREDRRDRRRQQVRPPKPLLGGSSVLEDDGNYRIGTDDPVITPDAGAGGWRSKLPAYTVRPEYAAI